MNEVQFSTLQFLRRFIPHLETWWLSVEGKGESRLGGYDSGEGNGEGDAGN